MGSEIALDFCPFPFFLCFYFSSELRHEKAADLRITLVFAGHRRNGEVKALHIWNLFWGSFRVSHPSTGEWDSTKETNPKIPL